MNVPAPLPVVPVHRAAMDDRPFWAGGASRDAFRVQKQHDFWVACLDGALSEVHRLVNQEGVDASAQVGP